MTAQLTIAIITFRRPQMLAACIESLIGQCAGRSDVAIIVVDNDPAGSARTVAQDYGAVRYVLEARPGVAHARNRAVAGARGGDYLAFIDDDETAEPGWVEALRAHVAKGVQASFGIVTPRFEAFEDAALEPLLARIYRRDLRREQDADISTLSAYCGTGNSLFAMTACFPDPDPFSLRHTATGGEDVALLEALVRRGIRLTWNPAAIVIEHVPLDRTRYHDLKARRLRQGQQRVALLQSRPAADRIAATAMWMGVGALQWAAHGTLAAAKRARGDHGWKVSAIQSAGGLGKMLWWRLWSSQAYAGALAGEQKKPG